MRADVFASYVERSPGKAAAQAVALLGADDESDVQRGRLLAVALRSLARCAVCGRELKATGSVEAGIGPECRGKRREARRALDALRSAGFDVLDPAELAPDPDEEEPAR